MAWWNRLSKRTQWVATIIGWSIAVAGALIAFGATQAKGELGTRIDSAEVRLNAHDQRLQALDSLRADVRDIRCILTADVRGTDRSLCLSTFRTQTR